MVASSDSPRAPVRPTAIERCSGAADRLIVAALAFPHLTDLHL
jgi:hypothetical protein